MTIPIPASYDSTSNLAGANTLQAGSPINKTALQRLAANHNHLWSIHRPPVAYAFSGRGWPGYTAATAGYMDVLAAEVREELDGRGLTVEVITSNGTSTAGELKVYAGATSATAAVAGSEVHVRHTLTLATPTSGDFVVKLQSKADGGTGSQVTIHGWCVYWTPNAGSSTTIAETLPPSGYRFFQPDALDTHAPLTVEQVNRFRGGPKTLWQTVPGVLFSLQSDLYSTELQNESTAKAQVAKGAVIWRWPPSDIQVRIRALFIGNSGSTCQVSIGGQSTTLTPGYTLGAAPGVLWTSGQLTFSESAAITLDSPSTLTPVDVYLTGGSGSPDARLYSLTIEVV